MLCSTRHQPEGGGVQLPLFTGCECGCGQPPAQRFVHGHNSTKTIRLPEWDPIEIAWAAGLFEGEGCISVHRSKGRRPQPKLNIAMTDLEPMERFAKALGVGNVTGPY